MQRYRGFSFAEVMFAVVILGIGFIMVASIFPVAAEQSRNTHDEAIATELARDAIITIQGSTTVDDFVNTMGQTRTLEELGLWNKLSSSMICKTDRRYACVPIFSQKNANSPVRVTVLVVRRWLYDGYSVADETKPSTSTLNPRGLGISSLTVNADGSGVVQIKRDDQKAYQSVAPGAFLILRGSGDSNFSDDALRIGNYIDENSDTISWKILPGNGLDAAKSYADVAYAAVIGRDLADVNDLSAGYTGPAQDVSVFTAFLHP